MRFVIIGSPRTGSSHLVNMLGAHPEIWCHGNIFKTPALSIPVFSPGGRLSDSEKERFLHLRDADESAFLEEVFQLDYCRPNIGFKIFEGQSNLMLEKILGDISIKKVILYRDNVLANYSSMRAAQESGQWGAKEHTVVEPPPINFHKRDFIKFHNSYVAFYRNTIGVLTGSGQPFFWMDYTAINDPNTLGALVTFIGADGSIPISETQQRKQQVKQNSADILSRFAKPRKVRTFLEENNLLHWLHEGFRNIQSIEEPMIG